MNEKNDFDTPSWIIALKRIIKLNKHSIYYYLCSCHVKDLEVHWWLKYFVNLLSVAALDISFLGTGFLLPSFTGVVLGSGCSVLFGEVDSFLPALPPRTEPALMVLPFAI